MLPGFFRGRITVNGDIVMIGLTESMTGFKNKPGAAAIQMKQVRVKPCYFHKTSSTIAHPST
jgi:hypothetical protein